MSASFLDVVVWMCAFLISLRTSLFFAPLERPRRDSVDGSRTGSVEVDAVGVDDVSSGENNLVARQLPKTLTSCINQRTPFTHRYLLTSSAGS